MYIYTCLQCVCVLGVLLWGPGKAQESQFNGLLRRARQKLPLTLKGGGGTEVLLSDSLMWLLKGFWEASTWFALRSHKDFRFIHKKYMQIL